MSDISDADKVRDILVRHKDITLEELELLKNALGHVRISQDRGGWDVSSSVQESSDEEEGEDQNPVKVGKHGVKISVVPQEDAAKYVANLMIKHASKGDSGKGGEFRRIRMDVTSGLVRLCTEKGYEFITPLITEVLSDLYMGRIIVQKLVKHLDEGKDITLEQAAEVLEALSPATEGREKVELRNFVFQTTDPEGFVRFIYKAMVVYADNPELCVTMIVTKLPIYLKRLVMGDIPDEIELQDEKELNSFVKRVIKVVRNNAEESPSRTGRPGGHPGGAPGTGPGGRRGPRQISKRLAPGEKWCQRCKAADHWFKDCPNGAGGGAAEEK